jgi:outer membrane biosynthesis protein TonB
MRRTFPLGFLTVVVLSLAISGCTRAQARVNPELPPLDVPEPPPRNVEVAEPQPLPATAVQEAPTSAPTLKPQPATQQRPEPARPEAPRIEPVAPPAEAPKPVEDVRGQPPPTLQTTPAGREAQVEGQILETLRRASASLNRVDYRALNANAQTQYDGALRFITQAREALRDRNLVYATSLADKAQALAAQLAGR